MTTSEDAERQEPEIIEEESSSYTIDPSRLVELDRSLAKLLLSRRCPSCRARIGSNSETPSEEEHIKEIVSCCSGQEGFIRPEMPMQEIVFRTLLSGGFQPMSLDQLHYEVTDRWYSPVNPRSISAKGLKLVLDNDMYYGFKKVSESSTEE